MPTSQLFTPTRAPSLPEPTLPEWVDETDALAGVVPLYGPPVIALAGPWLFLALMLAPPFAVLVTLVVALVAAAAVVALIGAILVAPYLLVRRLRRFRAPCAPMRGPAPRPAPLVPRQAR
jgi:hypothetical protein